jgi:hypothetical protein
VTFFLVTLSPLDYFVDVLGGSTRVSEMLLRISLSVGSDGRIVRMPDQFCVLPLFLLNGDFLGAFRYFLPC